MEGTGSGESATAPREGYFQNGLTNAPLPAMSHTATRAHVQPLAFVFQSKRLLPNSRVEPSSIVSRCVLLPSPHTISAKRSGKVHDASTDATISPADDFEKSTWGSRTSPVVVKN